MTDTSLCGLCGQPARGYATVDSDGETIRLCHDDDLSCYHRWTVYGWRPDGIIIDSPVLWRRSLAMAHDDEDPLRERIIALRQLYADTDARKVELIQRLQAENARLREALERAEKALDDLAGQVTWHSNDAAAEGSRGDRLYYVENGILREALVTIAGTPTKSSPPIAHDTAAAALSLPWRHHD